MKRKVTGGKRLKQHTKKMSLIEVGGESFCWLGGSQAASDLELLTSVGIERIVCLAGKPRFPSNFHYFKAHLPDQPDAKLLPVVEKVSEFLQSIARGEKKRGKNK